MEIQDLGKQLQIIKRDIDDALFKMEGVINQLPLEPQGEFYKVALVRVGYRSAVIRYNTLYARVTITPGFKDFDVPETFVFNARYLPDDTIRVFVYEVSGDKPTVVPMNIFDVDYTKKPASSDNPGFYYKNTRGDTPIEAVVLWMIGGTGGWGYD